ncbi:DUF3617 family protein [Methylobacterium durans]|uniref:DUF3617 domain-containing protein n=1 Tax=Methylobacterium durans TaxID=2202825 RepID=UPI002AFF7164|nr:DUF3617 family protein [Methylobacterium durans]MEA1833883.1 DUF3617 family protein [Methylobacterium durans]
MPQDTSRPDAIRNARRRLALLALLVVGQPARADEALEPGRYAVEVRLELPHLDDLTARKVADLCLVGDAGAPNPGFAVLSDNNPLARCPISNLRRDGAELTFDIACEGRNAASGSARYVLSPGAFRGRIAMRMGGKNMTMTEVQAGRRTGPCAGPAPGAR